MIIIIIIKFVKVIKAVKVVKDQLTQSGSLAVKQSRSYSRQWSAGGIALPSQELDALELQLLTITGFE